jgi:hypothetical protein
MSFQVEYLSLLRAIGFATLIILVGYVVGKLTKRAIRYLFTRVGLDAWFKRFAIGKAMLRSGYTASEFFGAVASWIIYVTAVLLAIATASADLGVTALSEPLYYTVSVYVAGFVKAFIILVVGFTLVDAFIGYIYKSTELRSEVMFLTPVAEYLRILFYIAVLIFALEQGGLNVSTLYVILTPIIWGLTLAMVAIIIANVIQQVIRR